MDQELEKLVDEYNTLVDETIKTLLNESQEITKSIKKIENIYKTIMNDNIKK